MHFTFLLSLKGEEEEDRQTTHKELIDLEFLEVWPSNSDLFSLFLYPVLYNVKVPD